jgi:hypothetical protein
MTTNRVLTTTQSNAATLVDTEGQPYPVAPADGGSNGVLPPLYSVVLRPGDTTGADNVFTSWAALYAACAGIAGGVRVIVENTGGIPHITAGDWAINGWRFDGSAASHALTVFTGSQLVIDDGAHFVGDANGNLQVEFGYSIIVYGNWTSPIITIGTDEQGNVFLRENSQLAAIGASPFMHVTDTGNAYVLVTGISVIGDGTHATFTDTAASGANGLEVIAGLGSTVNANAVQASAGGVSYLEIDSSVNYTGPQTGATLVLQSQAAQVAYTPALSANWSGTNPTSVANALDRIAAKIGPIP